MLIALEDVQGGAQSVGFEETMEMGTVPCPCTSTPPAPFPLLFLRPTPNHVHHSHPNISEATSYRCRNMLAVPPLSFPHSARPAGPDGRMHVVSEKSLGGAQVRSRTKQPKGPFPAPSACGGTRSESIRVL